VSEVLEAIRVVNHFYEARAGNRKIVSQIMGIEGHLENQYWASRRIQVKITDYSTLTSYCEYQQDVTACTVHTEYIMDFLRKFAIIVE
jgi:hypothetical protein